MSVIDLKSSLASFFRRNSFTIAISIITICVLMMFVLQSLTIARQRDQIKSQNQALVQIKQLVVSEAKNARTTKEDINGINKHLDCIFQFFTQEDRSNKAIANTDDCELTETQTKTALPVTPKPTPSNTQTAPTTTTPSTPSSPAPTSDNSDDSFLNLLLSPVTSLIKIL